MTHWIDLPAPDEPVPAGYRGVWQRTLLETPEGRDTATPQGRAQLQGFCGITRITPGVGGQPDICTWHRRWDVQPPRSTPDAGYMVFETSERVIETGVHGRYLEVWERLPGSTGPYAALAELDAQGQPTGAMRFVAGRYALTVRPRRATWPADLRPDETLAELVQRHPAEAGALLDFELVFSETPA